jgi:hypothetical protein
MEKSSKGLLESWRSIFLKFTASKQGLFIQSTTRLNQAFLEEQSTLLERSRIMQFTALIGDHSRASRLLGLWNEF